MALLYQALSMEHRSIFDPLSPFKRFMLVFTEKGSPLRLTPRRPTWGTFIKLALVILVMLLGTSIAGPYNTQGRSESPDFEIDSRVAATAARVRSHRARCVATVMTNHTVFMSPCAMQPKILNMHAYAPG